METGTDAKTASVLEVRSISPAAFPSHSLSTDRRSVNLNQRRRYRLSLGAICDARRERASFTPLQALLSLVLFFTLAGRTYPPHSLPRRNCPCEIHYTGEGGWYAWAAAFERRNRRTTTDTRTAFISSGRGRIRTRAFFLFGNGSRADWKVAVRQAKVDLPFQCELRLFFNSHSCPACCTYCDLGSR